MTTVSPSLTKTLALASRVFSWGIPSTVRPKSRVLDFAVMFSPKPHPDLHFESVGEVTYRMVSTETQRLAEVRPDRFVFAHFSPAFEEMHRQLTPDLATSPVSVGQSGSVVSLLGAMGGSGYVLEKTAQDLIADGITLNLACPGLHATDRVRELGFETYKALLSRANLDIIYRTTMMAAAVTVACAVIAFPLAYYMARFAPRRTKTLLYLAVLMPLWSSYLVRVYSWKLILAREGVLAWSVDRVGARPVLDSVLAIPEIGGPSLSQSYIGMWVVFVYTWLPYMILPLVAALERVPRSFVEASGDLGAGPRRTFRRIILPLALPGLVAGSIFTFSLTLGDFIIPTIIGNSSFFIGATVYVHQGTTSDEVVCIPMNKAFAIRTRASASAVCVNL